MYGDNEPHPKRGLRAHRVALDEEGFRALVRGEVVRLRTADDHLVELILSDIGFGRMVDAVNAAIIEAPAAKRWQR